MPEPKGRFGIHGGQYIPEALMNAVKELEEAYTFYKTDAAFQTELEYLLNEYAGRPSLLYYAQRLTQDLGGAKIYLKREDLNHTGSHKINNVLGQALLAKKNGQNQINSRNGSGPARRRHRNRRGAYGYAMRHIYGRGGYKASAAQRI